jgi:predicted RND superfamily exporter protein
VLHPSSQRFVAWTVDRRGPLWAGAALLTLVGVVGTARLYGRLNGDLEALLPPDAPSVQALGQMRARVAGLQTLGVVVDFGSAERLPAADRFLDDLAVRIRAHGPQLVRSVRTGVQEERAFLERNAPLYADLADLVDIRRRIEARKRWEASKAFGSLLDDEGPPPVDFSDLQAKYERRAPVGSVSPTGRFSSAEKHLSLLLIEAASFSTGAALAERMLAAVRSDIAALGGLDHYAPGMRLGFSGDLATSAEEISALEADLAKSSILVVLAVLTVIFLYFRWWPSIVAAGLPLMVATLATFALVQLPPFGIHELNSNTAFLGSIVVGNGINFGLILLARYLERRRAGDEVEPALIEAVAGSRRATLIAALAAAASYASLLVTNFRGFRQFGAVGGAGMVLCWASAYLLMPPLLYWLDRGRRRVRTPRADWIGAGASALAAFVLRHARLITALATVITLIAGLQLRHISMDRLESDLSRLRRRDTWKNGEGYWGRRMDHLLGRYLSPTVILTGSSDQADAVAEQVRAAMRKPPLDALVSEVRTAADVLPRQQREKLAEVARIRRLLTPVVRAELDQAQLAAVDRYLGEASLAPMTEQSLPRSLRELLRERDGSFGRVVLVYPRLTERLWQTAGILQFTDELRRMAAGAAVAGTIPLSGDLLRAISRDGPLASAVALGAVVVIVVVLLGWRRDAAVVLGALLAGVLWMVGATLGLKVKINFANFVAFPITFGIGVDYGVNVAQRFVQEGRRDVWAAIRNTGGAVILCSSTTIIGYSSLLLAQNRALSLFGAIAVLGEITCVVAAVVALPAVLHLLAGRSGRGLAERLRGTPPRMLTLTLLGIAAYLGVAAATFGLRLEQPLIAAVMILLCVWSVRSRQIFTGLLPFFVFGVIYDLSRLAQPLLRHLTVHVREPYRFDQIVFGVSTAVGRLTPNELFARHHWPAVDFITGVSYIVYIYWALAFAIYLLMFRRDDFGRSLLARLGWTFAAVNVVGFATYYLYPAAPPWYVAAHGFGPADLSVHASPAAAARWDALTGIPYFANFYGRAADVFGAIPSLHVAYPLLVFLYARELRRRGLDVANFLFYLVVCFAAVYLQHHYVLDVMVGTAYGLAGFGVERLISARSLRRSVIRAGTPGRRDLPEHEPAVHGKIPQQADRRAGDDTRQQEVQVQDPEGQGFPGGVQPQAGRGDQQVAQGLPLQRPAAGLEGDLPVEEEVGDRAAQGAEGGGRYRVDPQAHDRGEDPQVDRSGDQRADLEAQQYGERMTIQGRTSTEPAEGLTQTQPSGLPPALARPASGVTGGGAGPRPDPRSRRQP